MSLIRNCHFDALHRTFLTTQLHCNCNTYVHVIRVALFFWQDLTWHEPGIPRTCTRYLYYQLLTAVSMVYLSLGYCPEWFNLFWIINVSLHSCLQNFWYFLTNHFHWVSITEHGYVWVLNTVFGSIILLN